MQSFYVILKEGKEKMERVVFPFCTSPHDEEYFKDIEINGEPCSFKALKITECAKTLKNIRADEDANVYVLPVSPDVVKDTLKKNPEMTKLDAVRACCENMIYTFQHSEMGYNICTWKDLNVPVLIGATSKLDTVIDIGEKIRNRIPENIITSKYLVPDAFPWDKKDDIMSLYTNMLDGEYEDCLYNLLFDIPADRYGLAWLVCMDMFIFDKNTTVHNIFEYLNNSDKRLSEDIIEILEEELKNTLSHEICVIGGPLNTREVQENSVNIEILFGITKDTSVEETKDFHFGKE